MTLLARIRRTLSAFRPRPVPVLTSATIDLNAEEIARDPFPHYEALRAAGPVQFLARHHAWIILGYDEVQWAFTRPELFSNRPYEDVDAVLLGSDPPAHTDVRRIVSPYFARDIIERLATFAAESAAQLLERADGPLDVVGGYGRPLSEAVAARLLGLDDPDAEAIRASILRADDFHQSLYAIDGLADRAAIYERLRGDGFQDAAARSLVRLFWVASTATTERVIAHCVFALLEHPDARTAIETNPPLVPAFIDEVMRLHPPEPMLRRRTTAAVELAGAHIPAGADVYLCLPAANRDPRRYDQPSALRLDREAPRPLIFGHGIHHCIGATLGRATVAAAVRTLLTRAPRFRAAQAPESVRRCASMITHHFESLVIDVA
jgi:cytochrome P450